MTSEQIKEAIEDFQNLLSKQEKLQNRLIKLNGRDPEQETLILQRLEKIEVLIELIYQFVYDDEILTIRESCIVLSRLDGYSIKEISDFFDLTTQGTKNILVRACKKISDTYNQTNIA
ncbi:hypothetical protein M4A92_15720 [Caldibacillus thermoamylovorans]|uniref:hypothetical protein n=1 Tax=Caldibacillus thermoamylovorans TaxID=35841 RepID=UPI00203C2CEF|nr:hypothetical protein [Caldibacillus thermoamylovorans]MCM3800043.1 hypothetical protein [Caldibacillus thermoamylovorans]